MLNAEPKDLREFVGFVWQGDDFFGERIGVLIMATSPTDAASQLRATYRQGFGVSVWNELDAAKLR